MSDHCAALDWNRDLKDYIPCSPSGKTKRVRLLGIFTVEVLLCEAHRMQFEEEFRRFGGHLDQRPRVIILEEK